MKRLLIATALVSLSTVGTAFATISSDLTTDQIYGSSIESSANFSNLPATAAGRPSNAQHDQNFRSMQDHPGERVSGI